MRYTEAIDAHIDEQYAEYKGYDFIKPEDRLTRDGYVDPDYSGDRYIMTREVATLVAREMGELVTFGTFNNCREHGVTVTSAGGWTFCYYEHRNSDDLCIEGCPTAEVKPYGPYGGADKRDVMFSTRYEDYAGVADALVAMLRASVEQDSPTRQSLMAVTQVRS